MNWRGFLNTGISIVVIISFLATGQQGAFIQTTRAQDDIRECTEEDYLLWDTEEDAPPSTVEITTNDRFRANIRVLDEKCFWESGSGTKKGLKAADFDDSARKSFPQITTGSTYSAYFVMELKVGPRSMKEPLIFHTYAIVREPKKTSDKAKYMGLFPFFTGIPKHHQWSGPRYIKTDRNGYPTNAVSRISYLDNLELKEVFQYKVLWDLQGKTMGKDVKEGPYTLTDKEWIKLFEECLADSNNKHIIEKMKITDNGDSSPSINFDEQNPENCPIKMPKVSFTMKFYETWKDGNRTFFGELLHISSPGLLVYNNIKNKFSNRDDAAWFTFVTSESPVIIVVDHDGDVEFFVVTSKGELKSVAGGLAPLWGAEISAASSFYPVVGNKVIMKPGCTTPIPWPSNNGNWYSSKDRPEDLSDCLYTPGDGWLSKWGIQSQNKDQGCSITWVLTGAKQGPTSKIFQSNIVGSSISNILNRLTLCIFDGIIQPALEWASELITNVAGLSMWHMQGPEIKIEYYS